MNTEQYLEMQRRYYESDVYSPEQLVGCYDFHENFPYETLLLFKNGDVRRPIFENFHERTALDCGCGEGRMVRRMSCVFRQVDGFDMSSHMLAAAQSRCPGSQFYLSSGTDCGSAPLNHYDFAYCTISLQHICCYTIRQSIMQNIAACLTAGGRMVFQMIFNKEHRFPHHAQYFEDRFSAPSTNGSCDVLIAENDLNAVREDLGKIFRNIDFWFWDVSIGRNSAGRQLPPVHPNSHIDEGYWATHFIFIYGEK